MEANITAVIKQNIERYVSEHDMTRGALASRIGISRSSLYEKMDGKRPWLLDEIISLASLMGCEEKELWTANGAAS
jgi:DNA-binding XRE family transcriptional regulator